MSKNKISVSELNKYIAKMFNTDFVLNNVSVCGEVSNLKMSNGTTYFNLKDSESYIKCILFQSIKSNINFQIKEGDSLIVYGRVSVYEPWGQYSIIINNVEKDGIGKLYEEYEKLKLELEEKGMFDPMYKKQIPKYNINIGIVTSKTGAVIEDMKRIIFNKNPHLNIILYPSLVQGDGAADSIIEGIEYLDKLNLDVIIVGRGGGSFEDLNCFNNKKLAYAVFNAQTPIVSAVGHEVDYTIIDFVADERCATPTEAADRVSWSMDDFQINLASKLENMSDIFYNKLNDTMDDVLAIEHKIKLLSPKAKIDNYKTRIINNNNNLKILFNNKFKQIKFDLDSKIKILDSNSPLKKLQKGFGYLEKENHKKVLSINNIEKNSKISIYLHDGIIKARVEEKQYAK